MGRPYDMSRRGVAAAATREGILDAAHRLLGQAGAGGLSLQEVAAAAGVSRATLYKRVGSRRVLLAALFEDQGRRIGFDQVLAAIRLPDPRRAIVATVRESCRAWTVSPGAVRRTLALAALDAEVGSLVRKYESYRRAEMEALILRAHRAGSLAPGLGVAPAAATLALLTGFAAFDSLSAVHGARTATEHLVRMARSSLGIP